MPQRRRLVEAQFELTIRTDRALCTIIMRTDGRPWTVIDYWPNGEIHSKADASADEVMAILNKIKEDREHGQSE